MRTAKKSREYAPISSGFPKPESTALPVNQAAGSYYGGEQDAYVGNPKEHFSAQDQQLHIEHVTQPQNYLILAICIACFINPPFGAGAVVCSLLSTKAYKRGNIEPAHKYGKRSLHLSIAGIVTTILIMCVIILVLFTISDKNTKHSMSFLLEGN